MGTIVVVIAGGPIDPSILADHPAPTAVVAVDGGVDGALGAGLAPTVVVGDLDSASPAGLQWAADHGVPVERHPVDKDDTDTALALRHLADTGDLWGNDLVLLGADGAGRLDHVIGTLLALGAPELALTGSITAAFGRTLVHVLHPPGKRHVAVGSGRTFSLLAVHGTCTGVCIDGARWPLDAATLTATSTLGLSNVAEDDTVTVSVGEGVLTVIVPEDAR
jgi:thiamine pyrophosphokinase